LAIDSLSLHGKPDNELEIQPKTENAFGSARRVQFIRKKEEVGK
jgi:hypothetical protein